MGQGICLLRWISLHIPPSPRKGEALSSAPIIISVSAFPSHVASGVTGLRTAHIWFAGGMPMPLGA
jgi:hypothetical protein